NSHYRVGSTIHAESGSEQENTEFLTRPLVRVDEMERLGVRAPNHVLEVGPHIHKLLGSRAFTRIVTRPEPCGDNACPDCYAPHGLENRPDALPGSASCGEPGFSAIAEYGPDRDGSEGTRGMVWAAGIAFECDAEKAVTHFANEVVGGDWEFEEEGEFRREAVVLDAEPDVAAAVAEDGADYHGFGGARWCHGDCDSRGVGGGGCGGRRRGCYCGGGMAVVAEGGVVEEEKDVLEAVGVWGAVEVLVVVVVEGKKQGKKNRRRASMAMVGGAM
ncbi:hypothetical protein PIB30_095146, partial [Stylosanthes scabra]|nr:hypothetical protein [Stylosanthes scabra]